MYIVQSYSLLHTIDYLFRTHSCKRKVKKNYLKKTIATKSQSTAMFDTLLIQYKISCESANKKQA